MRIGPPEPGQLLRCAYLWADEDAAGQEEGRKDRPVAVVLALRGADDKITVAVAPITHSELAQTDDALEIPPAIKRMAGLDMERSWVVVTEINLFVWPGPDLRPASDDDDATAVIGYLPAGFFRSLRDRIVAQHKARSIRQVPRHE